MLQLAVFAFVAVSFFLVIAVPLTWSVWAPGKKIVFPGLVAWVSLLGLTGFLNATL